MIRREHSIPTAEPTDPAEAGFQRASDGKMWLDRRLKTELERAGLTGFRAVMSASGGQCLRVLADRENWRLELSTAGRPTRGAYLKKHHVKTLLSRLRAKLGMGAGQTAGRVEARNVGRLAAAGIGVMRLLAYGEELCGDGRLESFVLTEELEDYTPLDDFLRRRFTECRAHRRTLADHQVQRLLRQVATLAGGFHRAGYNHRDLYCCHFFISESEPGQFDVKLIDLQRVQRRRRFRRRWLVKDLAQLAYSAPRDRIKCTHKLAFMRHYLGVRKLRADDKRLIRQVLAKQRLMERKRGIAA